MSIGRVETEADLERFVQDRQQPAPAAAVSGPFVHVAAAYEVTDRDWYVICDGTFTVTLPAAEGRAGRSFYVVNKGAGTITVAAAAGGIAPTSIAASGWVLYLSDGVDWIGLD